jgi:hypothetical protein
MSVAQRVAAARLRARREIHATFGVEATYVPQGGGDPYVISAIRRQPDIDVHGGMQGRAWSPALVIEILACDLRQPPRDGDQVWIDGVKYAPKAPRRLDPHAEVWTLEMQPL